jgi:hypothetical protein
VYSENVIVSKDHLTIKAAVKDSTIICGNPDGYGTGFGVFGAQFVTIQNFVVRNCSSGIILLAASNTLVDSNVFECCYLGIQCVNYSSFCTFSNNVFLGEESPDFLGHERPCGVLMFDCAYNTVVHNAFISSAMDLLWTNNNVIYGNDFLSPTISQTQCNDNIWYNEGAGNYWSTYEGVDQNHDGIGDTAYVSPAQDLSQIPAIDEYPLMQMSPDVDKDNIPNEIDVDPLYFSNAFSDLNSGGVTTGFIVTRGEQLLTIVDDNTLGVKVTAEASGGSAVAVVSVTGKDLIYLSPGDEIVLTTGSVHIKVLKGQVETEFIADDGTVATAELVVGNELGVEPSVLLCTSSGEVDANIVINDQTYTLDSDEAMRFASSVDLQPKTLSLGANGKWVTAYIELPSSYNVNDIKQDTVKLHVGSFEIYADVKANPIIGDYDNDGYADLMLKFPRAPLTTTLLESGNADAPYLLAITISGALTDGTYQFNSVDQLKILPTK